MASIDHASRDALQFCDELDGLHDPVAVAAAIKSFIGNFGFDHFIITGIPDAKTDFEQAVLLRHWPKGWFENYVQEDFVRIDPVIRVCHTTTSLFDWAEVPYDAEREPDARRVMHSAIDFGLNRGMSLPIHGLDGYETCFSVSGRAPDLSVRLRPALHLMMTYAYERLRQIMAVEIPGSNPLTPREAEVLCWAAAGKSAAETAELMAITPRTVNAHAGSAIAKLGASNRTQAVVRAMKYRYIRV